MTTKELKKDWTWVGTLDPELRVFDIIMHTEFGTTYNSYLLKGSEKTALFEASKFKFNEDYLNTLAKIVDIKDIDYLIVNHTEPDHSGAIEVLLEKNPAIKIVGTATAINFMKEIANSDFNAVVVKDKDELSLGNKTLQFICVPNLHWPDTMFTYIKEDKVIVTCDSFGAHYSSENITNENLPSEEDYMKALKYYYDMIIGPFKPFMLEGIKRVRELEIDHIYPGHGPVLVKDPMKVVDIYEKWSTEVNPNKKKTVVIPYVSAYGYTKMLAEEIEKGIKAAADIDVRSYDVIDTDPAKLGEEMYFADGLLFGTPTIVGEALKPIWDLTTSMFSRTHSGKIASAFGSYGWSGEGVPHIIDRLVQLKMKVYTEGYKIRFKPNESQLRGAYEFGYNFGKSVEAGKIVEPEKLSNIEANWRCLICGEIIRGVEPPEACPVCGVPKEQFVREEASTLTFMSDRKETVVIIGNGAAGVYAADEARKRNKNAVIKVITEESVAAYNRPMLTKGFLTELEMLNFYVKPETWYKENDIALLLDKKVKAIDRKKHTVNLEDGEAITYDKLILAVGAKSFIPNVEGKETKGVFAVRSFKDVEKIKEYIKDVTKVTIVGGGILGLEAAWEMRKSAKEVTVVHAGNTLMERQLDQKASEILEKAAEKAGIKVISPASPTQIEEKNGRVGALVFSDGAKIETDMVIFSTGITPNVDLAKESGLETDRFIKVDVNMKTSDQNIFAAGDCAAYNNQSFGIWSQAVEMGKVAGANAAGDSLEYEKVTPSNSFIGMGLEIFSIGDVGKDEEKMYKSVEIYDKGRKTYEKLYFLNNRFVGGILIGDTSKSARLIEAFKKEEPMSKLV